MVQKNDLSAYQAQPTKAVLKAVEQAPVPRERKPRAPKPAAQKRSEKVLLSFTPAEMAKVREKAGLVPVATWLVARMKEEGVIE